eukprot:4703974-Amphidinium_carterae.1
MDTPWSKQSGYKTCFDIVVAFVELDGLLCDIAKCCTRIVLALWARHHIPSILQIIADCSFLDLRAASLNLVAPCRPHSNNTMKIQQPADPPLGAVSTH